MKIKKTILLKKQIKINNEDKDKKNGVETEEKSGFTKKEKKKMMIRCIEL